MLEPPSEHLQHLLAGLQLCSAHDLRRCRPRVRRLSHDLPAFDSVWIDALVQARKLTSFQAKILESPRPERLRIGPCLLIDRLGKGVRSETFLARQLGGKELCVLKQTDVAPEVSDQILAAMTDLIHTFKRDCPSGLVIPHAAIPLDRSRLVLVSRYVCGLSLAELLVRRGRFPANVVNCLGRQMLDVLGLLESRGCIHGDLRLANVRLTKQGTVTFVDAGLNPVLEPELTIHATLPPERYDGTAPELIGTGLYPSATSDLYALGCLLWQLLAGRPPFPAGDPLDKLAAHQSLSIADVRQWVPDTPPWLAEALSSFCAKDPAERPQSFRAALDAWGPTRRGSRRKRRLPHHSDRRRLRKFRAIFDVTVSRVPLATSPRPMGRWTTMAMLLFVVSGAVLSLIDQGARNYVLSLTSRVSTALAPAAAPHETGVSAQAGSPDVRDTSPSAPSPSRPTRASAALRPLPPPNAEGIIQLEPGDRYESAEVAAHGPLTIRGPRRGTTRGTLPLIVVRQEPMRIWAEQVQLINVHVLAGDALEAPRTEDNAVSQGGPNDLLHVQTQNLAIVGCRFQTRTLAPAGAERNSSESAPSGEQRPIQVAAVRWRTLDASDRGGGCVVLKDTIFGGPGASLFSTRFPRKVDASNCLKSGGGPFLVFGTGPQPAHDTDVALDQVTLRRAQALIQFRPISESETATTAQTRPTVPGGVFVQATDCVFDLRPDESALVQWLMETLPHGWSAAFDLTGEGSLANPGLVVATWIDRSTGRRTELDATQIPLEGISTGPFEFVGPLGPEVQNSAVKTYEAPRRSSRPPGIDPQRLGLPVSALPPAPAHS